MNMIQEEERDYFMSEKDVYNQYFDYKQEE